MTACAPRAEHAPPPPPGAQVSREEGPQEQRLDSVVLEIRDALQDKARPLQVVSYRLPAGAAWPEVAAHYDRAVAWPRDGRLADHLRGAQARAWRQDGKVVAIALIEGPLPGGDPRPLLVVASD